MSLLLMVIVETIGGASGSLLYVMSNFFSVLAFHLPHVGGTKVAHGGISYDLGVLHPALVTSRVPGDDIRVAGLCRGVDGGLSLHPEIVVVQPGHDVVEYPIVSGCTSSLDHPTHLLDVSQRLRLATAQVTLYVCHCTTPSRASLRGYDIVAEFNAPYEVPPGQKSGTIIESS